MDILLFGSSNATENLCHLYNPVHPTFGTIRDMGCHLNVRDIREYIHRTSKGCVRAVWARGPYV